jgi:hypothetical protein
LKLTEIQSSDLLKDDTFSFFMPIEVMRKADGDKDTQRKIKGVASTADKDLQGETVLQSGIDFSYFLKYGYINDDHKDGPENKVGEPTECRLTPQGLWIAGFLYKGKERSDFWWDHLQALARNDSKRKVGFSIQGKIQRREGSTIVKCWLQDVAITASPVNTHTWAEIAKSLNSQKWCLHPLDPVCKGGCCTCGPGMKKGDLLTATVESKTKDKEDEDKALTAGGMGRMIVPQSLEGSAKNVHTPFNKSEITYPEAVAFLAKSKGYSAPVAKAFADAIFATRSA